MVEVHVNYSVSSVKFNGLTLADIITDAVTALNAYQPPVSTSVSQSRQTSVKRCRSDFEDHIREQHQRALRDVCPPKLLSYCVDLLTDFALSKVHLEHADNTNGTGVILHCWVTTAEALSELGQLIDSGRLFSEILKQMTDTGLLSRLFGSIFRWFAGNPTVSLSTEEYSTALAALTGKLHIVVIVTMKNMFTVWAGMLCHVVYNNGLS